MHNSATLGLTNRLTRELIPHTRESRDNDYLIYLRLRREDFEHVDDLGEFIRKAVGGVLGPEILPRIRISFGVPAPRKNISQEHDVLSVVERDAIEKRLYRAKRGSEYGFEMRNGDALRYTSPSCSLSVHEYVIDALNNAFHERRSFFPVDFSYRNSHDIESDSVAGPAAYYLNNDPNVPPNIARALFADSRETHIQSQIIYDGVGRTDRITIEPWKMACGDVGIVSAWSQGQMRKALPFIVVKPFETSSCRDSIIALPHRPIVGLSDDPDKLYIRRDRTGRICVAQQEENATRILGCTEEGDEDMRYQVIRVVSRQ